MALATGVRVYSVGELTRSIQQLLEGAHPSVLTD